MPLYYPIYEDIFEASNSTWNLNSMITTAVLGKVKKIIEQIPEHSAGTPNAIPLDTTEIEDWKNIAAFEELFKLANFDPKGWDWSTEAVGSFFIKNLKLFKENCKDIIQPTAAMELVNNIFTLPEQSLSLVDIALIYTANDFRVINKNHHFDGSKQLNQSLRGCLKDVHTTFNAGKNMDNVNVELGTDKYIHHTEKYLEQSPCLNLKKFPTCSHYCTLHEKFFEKIPLIEFLTLMRYAMPQRKFR